MLAAALLAGSLVLHPCGAHQTYYCGSLARPLDTTGRIAGRIDIGFTWLPHARRNVPSAGTIVAAEGGPGYPSGASRDAYRALFGPLLLTHDMLLMDDRGTGRSGAIDCRALQGGSMTLPAIARCGAQLGATAGLYGSAEAADDLDALMDRLAVTRADLYGDSYGTFFVQTFAARHPGRVRRIVLDGAYPAGGLDPWYSSTTPAIAGAFDAVCRRSSQCAARGAAMPRIGRILALLRAGRGPIDPSQLAFVMDTAGLDSLVYRELDAAVRAWLGRGDGIPLRRLAREAWDFEEAASSDPREESNGLFVAASCTDNPQAYDMRLAPALRQAQWRSIERRMVESNPQLYAPFTVKEFLSIPLDYAYVPLCQNWPVAPAGHPAGQPFPPGTQMPDVPALVLTGDLDTITTPSEGDAAAKLVRALATGHRSQYRSRDGDRRSVELRVRARANVSGGALTRHELRRTHSSHATDRHVSPCALRNAPGCARTRFRVARYASERRERNGGRRRCVGPSATVRHCLGGRSARRPL